MGVRVGRRRDLSGRPVVAGTVGRDSVYRYPFTAEIAAICIVLLLGTVTLSISTLVLWAIGR